MTPKPASRRPNRHRPFIGGSVGADVASRVQAEAAETGKPVARVIDALLRRALGLPDDDAYAGSPARCRTSEP